LEAVHESLLWLIEQGTITLPANGMLI